MSEQQEQEVKIPTSEEILSQEPIAGEESQDIHPEFSAEESLAMSQGWVPKDQWKGDPNEWRPAKEFNERGELFTRIRTQSKELQELKQAMSFLTTQQQKQFQAGWQQAVATLKAQRNAHLEEGNVLEAQKITDKIEEMKEQRVQTVERAQQAPANTPGPSSTFVSWHTTNPWYLQDKVLTRHADVIGLQFKEENPELTEADMLQHVARQIRKEFPDRFGVKGPPSPDGEGRNSPRGQPNSASSSLKGVEATMTEEQRGIMRTILKSTGMTKEQYLKQYNS